MDDQIKMETKGSSFYVYGITEKPIKIPSQLYPVSGSLHYFYNDVTEPFPKDEKTEIIKRAFNSVDFEVGRCYSNTEKLLAALEKEGIQAHSFVGWEFIGSALPVHHCFAVIDNHILDLTIKTSLFYKEELKGLSLEELRKELANIFFNLKETPNSDKATFGQMDKGMLFVGSPCKPSVGLANYKKLIKAFPKHPCYRNIVDGTNETQREIYNRMGIEI